MYSFGLVIATVDLQVPHSDPAAGRSGWSRCRASPGSRYPSDPTSILGLDERPSYYLCNVYIYIYIDMEHGGLCFGLLGFPGRALKIPSCCGPGDMKNSSRLLGSGSMCRNADERPLSRFLGPSLSLQD